jgi:hypothetical protein
VLPAVIVVATGAGFFGGLARLAVTDNGSHIAYALFFESWISNSDKVFAVLRP